MKRKIYSELLKWKQERNGECAILIEGPRRVGKSYIVNEFAKKEYKSCIIIDFNIASKQIKNLFEDYLDDLDTFFMFLSNFMNTPLYLRNSIIVFDEVQLFPRARTAIKYLVADGRYDYIETGSLVSINKNVKDIVIPSEEHRIEMFPMDFEEFLWANGNDMLMPLIKHCFEKKQALGPLHRKAMDYFRQYIVVGGMPQAVLTFVESKDLTKVDIVKRDIINLYRNDIEKYATGFESKVKAIFDQVPSQLQKHEKKFKLSEIDSNARFREYESSFFWLAESKVINICYLATEPSIGLRMKLDSSSLKCYLADTGLLISMAFDENTIVNQQVYMKLLADKLEVNMGMVVENIVAQMLRASRHKLYFYSQYSNNSEDRMEIDFLIGKSSITSRHNINPIEVKSSNNYTISSLKKCIKKYANQLSTPYVVHPLDLYENQGILYLPLYMVPLL